MRAVIASMMLSASLLAKEVIIDLKDPVYEEGVITTASGGVVREGDMRIQAQNIEYTHKPGEDIERVIASGHLMVLYGRKVMIGKRLEYDFKHHCGIIHDGMVVEEPWVLGGQSLILREDGSYIVRDGYATLCETRCEDFAIESRRICMQKNRMIQAEDVGLRLFRFNLFTIPTLKSHLSTLTDMPVQVKFVAGGIEGSYVSFRYRAITLPNFKAFLRADFVFFRGPGAGIDTNYCNKAEGRSFVTKNFAVWDRSYDDPSNFFRYRFEGNYHEVFCEDAIDARLVYDFLSDTEMASDFSAKEFELYTGQNTELLVTRQMPQSKSSLTTRVRVNSFQTVNQELPLFEGSLKPQNLGNSGIISDTQLSAGYLNYVYASGTPNINDYDSTRCELNQILYRPFHPIQGLTFTPDARLTVIQYSDSQIGVPRTQAVTGWGGLASLAFSRHSSKVKHVVEPYLSYQNFSRPTVGLNEVLIFNLQDGYSRYQLVRFGIRNSFFEKCDKCIMRPIYLDVWANAFYSTNTLEKRVPRIYSSLSLQPFSTFYSRLGFAWNRETNSVEYCNLQYLWTASEDLALGLDFFARGPRAWRKVDYDNFMLDAGVPESILLNSLVSDERRALLGKLFYRINPSWSFTGRVRCGWHENTSPQHFVEYEVGLATVLGCNWHMKVGYEHREIDDRFLFSFRLGQPAN